MDILAFINEQMGSIAAPYEFGEWSSAIVYPYFVGEITELPTMTEDGFEEFDFILTGFHRGAMIDLLTVKEKIKSHFDPIYGLRGETDSGAIAVFYDGFFTVPTGEADLKKIQINLKINVWKGAI